MTQIAITEQCVFAVSVDVDQAYEFFSQPQQFRLAMDGVVTCDEGVDGTVHWLLEEQSGQGVRFQPDYTVKYTCIPGQSVCWESIDGNMRNEGEIRFVPRDDAGCDIHYSETVEPDLPITPLLMKLVKPLVVRELRQGLQGFIKRSQACLERNETLEIAGRAGE